MRSNEKDDNGNERRSRGVSDWMRWQREMEEFARGGDFFNFNDSTITPSSFTQIAQLTKRNRTDVAYLLFYIRVDGDEEEQAQRKVEENKDDGADSMNDEDDVCSVNPMLERLAVMEQQTWVRQQEKAAKEVLTNVMQRLPKLPDYKPPPDDYVDPDM